MELEDTVELMVSDGYKDRFRGEYQQTKIGHSCTKCPFCNSEAWIQTGVAGYSIEGEINSIRMICTNVHCQAIIKTEYDSKLSGLAYMGLLHKIKELRENPDEREKIIK